MQGETTNLTATMNIPQPPELNIDTLRSTTPMTTTRFTSTATTTTRTITTTTTINKPYGVKEIFKQFGSFSTRFTSTTTTTTTTITTTINKYYGIKEIFKQFSVWQPSRLPTTTTATTTTQLPVPLYGELLFSASIMTCTVVLCQDFDGLSEKNPSYRCC